MVEVDGGELMVDSKREEEERTAKVM